MVWSCWNALKCTRGEGPSLPLRVNGWTNGKSFHRQVAVHYMYVHRNCLQHCYPHQHHVNTLTTSRHQTLIIMGKLMVEWEPHLPLPSSHIHYHIVILPSQSDQQCHHLYPTCTWHDPNMIAIISSTPPSATNCWATPWVCICALSHLRVCTFVCRRAQRRWCVETAFHSYLSFSTSSPQHIPCSVRISHFHFCVYARVCPLLSDYGCSFVAAELSEETMGAILPICAILEVCILGNRDTFESRLSTSVNCRIFSIKCPGVYFFSVSVEGTILF